MISRFFGHGSAPARMLFLCCLCLLFDKLTALSCTGDLCTGAADEPEKEWIQQNTPQRESSEQLLGAPAQQIAVSAGKSGIRGAHSMHSNTAPSTYTALLDALDVMESHFFEISQGTWPQAIDWTAAVMGTQVSATLVAMTEFANPLSDPSSPLSPEEARDHENLINRYFTQITSFYFGENAFSLRTQAYDDMLWVVLGWLESIKFIELHSKLHYTSTSPEDDHHHKSNHSWYARQFIPQYAHRARLFYDLASRGWDTALCGGGMVWSPYLAPYKNAITNELFIAASVSMYLYFPGDSNASPFLRSVDQAQEKNLPPAKAHDIHYLDNAVEAYKWLKSSGMRNEHGLYVDGFHIKGWRGGQNSSNGTGKCDVRDDKVYTYNQGVILSALKGLWEATGSTEYLQDGHELVRNVIAATGWEDRNSDRKWRWAGLGRNGVLEEQCDWSGTCSQNGQTFKGIFFHHLTLFCTPLPDNREDFGDRYDLDAGVDDEDARGLHRKSCAEYGEWIRRNAFAAYVTRDENGVFGEWWGRPSPRRQQQQQQQRSNPNDNNEAQEEYADAKKMQGPPAPTTEETDYRNEGVPMDEIWRLPEDDLMYKSEAEDGRDGSNSWQIARAVVVVEREGVGVLDINDRGRGRTVETQSGGLAVLRALWRLVEARRDG